MISPTRSPRRTAAALVLSALVVGAAAPASAAGPSRRVGDSQDPTTASLAISQAAWADGTAQQVVIGRNDVFADNLGGTGLAATFGPVLLTSPTGGLPNAVRAEVSRLLGTPPPDCTNRLPDVYVLGGTGAVSAQTYSDLQGMGYCLARLAGDDRVATSVAIAKEILATSDTSGAAATDRGAVFLARSDDPADSAAAGQLAAATGNPIVVTPTSGLAPAVADLLRPGTSKWSQVILLGGTAALSAAVEQQVKAVATGSEVYRIAGDGRADTAALLATSLVLDTPYKGATIVNGYSQNFWVWALTGAVTAAREQAPLLYVQTDSIPSATSNYLRTAPADFVLTIGSGPQVSTSTQAAAESLVAQGPPAGG